MKILILLLSLFAFQLNAQFAHGWTTRLPADMVPSGATIPSVGSITGGSKAQFEVTVPGSLDNAVPATAFAAIGDAVLDTIEASWLLDVWGVDTTLDVTMKTVITEIIRGHDTFQPRDYSNQYKVAVDVFRIKGYSQWVIE